MSQLTESVSATSRTKNGTNILESNRRRVSLSFWEMITGKVPESLKKMENCLLKGFSVSRWLLRKKCVKQLIIPFRKLNQGQRKFLRSLDTWTNGRFKVKSSLCLFFVSLQSFSHFSGYSQCSTVKFVTIS